MKSLEHPSAPPAAVAAAGFTILLARHQGMCFGVRDALAEVGRLAADGPLTVLGQLVHNEVVREGLAARGALEGDLRAATAPTRRVVITAHGAADADRERWRAAGHLVADTTCPLVRRAHEALAALVAGGCAPVVIGRKDHVEVLGLTGDFPGTTVVAGPADLAALPEAPLLGVIAQTTQPEARVRALVAAIRRARPRSEVRFRDTVCRPTKERQAALDELLRRADFVLVVGGSNSNNCNELVASARAAGVAAERVARPAEINPAWLHGRRVVGVTAGTSTLPDTVAAVLRCLRARGGKEEA
jgi:4-hydroxy-3-methylbut-2-en-1-yl diphosphate reductase